MQEISLVSGVPLYIQIREAIRDRIRRNELGDGDKLPTEIQIAAEYGVSRMTVRQALDDLVNEGLLERKRGVGTFVTARITRNYTRLTSFHEEAIEQGLKPTSRILAIRLMPASEELANRLKIDPGNEVVYIERLRMLNKKPIALHKAFVPHELFPGIARQNLKGSLYELYYQTYKRPIVWATQRIEARIADQELAKLLKLDLGAPILYSCRITFTTNDIPIECVEAYASGAPFAIEVTLYRKPFNLTLKE